MAGSNILKCVRSIKLVSQHEGLFHMSNLLLTQHFEGAKSPVTIQVDYLNPSGLIKAFSETYISSERKAHLLSGTILMKQSLNEGWEHFRRAKKKKKGFRL